MRIEHVREFLVAAMTLNFTAAARKLYMSQPKMSMHISAMEDELGFPLFNREGGLTLTREGERFFEWASGMVESYDALVDECRSLLVAPASRIVMGEFSLFDLFPPTATARVGMELDRMARDDPSFEFVTVPLDNTLSIPEHLERGLCDISFCTLCLPDARPEVIDCGNGMSVLPLAMDPMVALVDRGHELAVRESVAVTDLARFPVPLSNLPSMETWNETRRAFFREHGTKPTFQTHAVSTPSSLVRPRNNREVFLVAKAFAEGPKVAKNDELVVLPISDARVQSCFCLCFATGTRDPAVNALVERLLAR